MTRAILKPLRPPQVSETCELLSRTSRDRIRVRLASGRVFAVDRFRLFSEDGRTKLDHRTFDALPWSGAGIDPVTPLLSDSQQVSA